MTATYRLAWVAVLLAAAGCGTGSHTPRQAGTPTGTSAPSRPSGKSYSPVPAPAGDRVLDVDLRDPANGWALLSHDCRTPTRCLVLSHTGDGGQHWQQLPATGLPVGQADIGCHGNCGATRVTFADADHGYLFNPGLYVTGDGGHTWRQATRDATTDLAVDGSSVLRIGFDHTGCPGPCNQHLDYTPIGGSAWTSATTFHGYGMPGRLTVSGSGAAYALFEDSLASGALHQPTLYRSTNRGRSWTQVHDPCAGREHSEASALTASGDRLVVLCLQHGGKGAAIRISTDSAVSFSGSRPVDLPFPVGPVAVTGHTVLAATGPVTGQGPVTFRVARSTDDGQHWQTTGHETQDVGGLPSYRTLLDAYPDGRAVWVGYPGHVWLSSDAGRTWHPHAADSL